MRDPFVVIALLVLTGTSLLNLALLLRLIAIVRPARSVVGLPAGATVPAAGTVAVADAGAPGGGGWTLPAAFVFLSTGCPACLDAIPVVEASLADADRAGLDLRVLVDGGETDGTAWLGTALGERAKRLTRRGYRRLNPHGAVPSYLFVDERGVVKASGYIGDEDWQSLTTQLAEA